jgi:hypothetical protein
VDGNGTLGPTSSPPSIKSIEKQTSMHAAYITSISRQFHVDRPIRHDVNAAPKSRLPARDIFAATR